MKTFTFLNTTVFFLLAALAMSTSASGLSRDLTGDGIVTVEDAQEFLRMVKSGSGPGSSFDLNSDGSVDLKDALLYGQWVNGLYQSPSYPPLFLDNMADTVAYKNYQVNLKNRKSSESRLSLMQSYPDSSSKADLNYQASEVEFLDSIQLLAKHAGIGATNFRGFQSEVFIQKLLQKGVAVTNSLSMSNFYTAFDAIHNCDLPVIFTTDAMLQAIYRSYDNILMGLETGRFHSMLMSMLKSSLTYAQVHYDSGDYSQDVKDYLTTALLLLSPDSAGVESTLGSDLYISKITSGQMTSVMLYGRYKTVDFSQFEPRGHYTNSQRLKNYFKAMMWLGRADLAFEISGEPIGAAEKAALLRMKKASLVLWDCVINSGSYPQWLRFNHTLEFMVGLSDGLHMKGMGGLAQRLGIKDVPQYLQNFNEAAFDSAVFSSAAGVQTILSEHKFYTPEEHDSLGLSQIFSFMPQRFVIDSYTFSQLVFPLVNYRELPSSLDIAFVLGDNSALGHHQELEVPAVAGILSSQRTLYDQISEKGWQSNMYYSWLNFLRKLNGAELNNAISPVFHTASWRHKMRNTQLTSWAHLRHNTILYAKQSMTGGIMCEFPRAMVEPYPEFFEAVVQYAKKGHQFFSSMDSSIAGYFQSVEGVSLRLKEAADYSYQGREAPPALSDWLKNMVTTEPLDVGCGQAKIYDGWYFDLVYDLNMGWRNQGSEWNSFTTIADVHTKPKDVKGPARVFHAATGYVNFMAVVVELDTCKSVFVGPVGSYYDVTTSASSPERINDQEWEEILYKHGPEAVRPSWAD